jgi:hypothetical protein
MSTPPKIATSVSVPYASQMQKKWFHRSKGGGGSIPMKASHRVTKAVICKLPEGVRLCRSKLYY